MTNHRRSNSFTVVVTLLSAAVAATLAVVPSATAQGSSPLPECPQNLLLAIPGTTETNEAADPNTPVGTLASVTTPLTETYGPDTLQVRYIPYMALIADDKAHTYGTSKKQAIDEASSVISDVAARCPNTNFGLTGFSQGADAAGDLAGKIGNGTGPVPADRMFGVGLLSDPGASSDAGVALGAPITSQGWSGARPGGFGTLDHIVATVCDKEDLYCDTGTDRIGMQFIGSLGSKIDAQDPAGSVAGVVTGLLGIDNVPIADTVDQLTTAATTGNMLALPQLAGTLASDITDLTSEVADRAVPGSDTQAILAGIATLTDAVSRADIPVVLTTLADLTPKIVAFAGELSQMIGQLVSQLPIAEYTAVGATVGRISANAAVQNYGAIPLDLGKLVGQLNNAVRKTLRALPLDQFPVLNRLADELTPGKVLDEVLDYATFLAADTHNSYGTKSIAASGRTGIDELVNYFRSRIDDPAAPVQANV